MREITRETMVNAFLSLIVAVFAGFLTTVLLSIAAYPFALGDAGKLLYGLGPYFCHMGVSYLLSAAVDQSANLEPLCL
jgi:hypothetical protein